MEAFQLENIKLADDDSAIIILDQSLLPNEEKYITLNDPDSCWEAIHSLRVRGAPAIGIFAGINTLPFIIYDAYRIMFYIGNIELVPHMPSIVLGTLAAVVCTTAVSVIVCAKSLHVKPAQAMRPKAPKAGKRILLERIPFLWKRLSFLRSRKIKSRR